MNHNHSSDLTSEFLNTYEARASFFTLLFSGCLMSCKKIVFCRYILNDHAAVINLFQVPIHTAILFITMRVIIMVIVSPVNQSKCTIRPYQRLSGDAFMASWKFEVENQS
jgi:hypothetical protein